MNVLFGPVELFCDQTCGRLSLPINDFANLLLDFFGAFHNKIIYAWNFKPVFMDLEDELDELEENFSKTEEEFDKIKDPEHPDNKQERAEELIEKIQDQLDFLREQVE